MKKEIQIPIILFSTVSFFLFGCSSQTNPSSDSACEEGEQRETITTILEDTSEQDDLYTESHSSIDSTCSHLGFIKVKYKGKIDKIKVQITNPDGTVYTYPLPVGDFQTFPLSGGDGSYQITVLENAYDTYYAIDATQIIDVTLDSEYSPFLYPNQYVDYDASSKCVKKGMKLSEEACDDIDFVNQVYEYVIDTITYDDELAKSVPTDYIPDPDQTLSNKTGICFDYASLMAAMLRSQQIPTKLVVGYSGNAYHAWISVYLKETGWVDNIIEFDGKSWSLMDPTLAANNSSSSVEKYIGDGSNYTVKYTY